LPGVRHVHRAPGTGGFTEFVPTLLLAAAIGIRAEPPFAAESHCVWQGRARRVRTRGKCRRANSANCQRPRLSQEFPTRMHRDTPLGINCEVTGYLQQWRPCQIVFGRTLPFTPRNGHIGMHQLRYSFVSSVPIWRLPQPSGLRRISACQKHCLLNRCHASRLFAG
jgi:hypothetical protein